MKALNYVTTSQAAKVLAAFLLPAGRTISPRTIVRYCHSGKLKAHKVGREWIIMDKALDAYIETVKKGSK